MRLVILLGLALVAILSAPLAAAADTFYKWTDEDGVTHYSSRKPPDHETETISVQTGRAVDQASEENGEPADADEDGEQAQTDQEQSGPRDPERCEAARDNLEVLRDNNRVRAQDEDGEFYYLDEEQIADRIAEAEQAVDESC